MANNVQVQQAGGQVRMENNVRTVGELRQRLGLGNDQTATVKGNPSNDNDPLRDYDFVAFGAAVRGGN